MRILSPRPIRIASAPRAKDHFKNSPRCAGKDAFELIEEDIKQIPFGRDFILNTYELDMRVEHPIALR